MFVSTNTLFTPPPRSRPCSAARTGRDTSWAGRRRGPSSGRTWRLRRLHVYIYIYIYIYIYHMCPGCSFRSVPRSRPRRHGWVQSPQQRFIHIHQFLWNTAYINLSRHCKYLSVVAYESLSRMQSLASAGEVTPCINWVPMVADTPKTVSDSGNQYLIKLRGKKNTPTHTELISSRLQSLQAFLPA